MSNDEKDKESQPSFGSAPSAPSWKELHEFISAQTDRDRNLVDKWFRLAASIIAVVITVVGLVLTLAGWKTLGEVRKAATDVATRTAEVEAKGWVKNALQTEGIRNLAQKAAVDLLQSNLRQEILSELRNGVVKGLAGPAQFQVDRKQGEDVTLTFGRVVKGQVLIVAASTSSVSDGNPERRAVGLLVVNVNDEGTSCGQASTSMNTAAGVDQELFASAGCIWSANQDYEKVAVHAHFRAYFTRANSIQAAGVFLPVLTAQSRTP